MTEVKCPSCEAEYCHDDAADITPEGITDDLRSTYADGEVMHKALLADIFMCGECRFSFLRVDAERISIPLASQEMWRKNPEREKLHRIIDGTKKGTDQFSALHALSAHLLAIDGYGLALTADIPTWHRRAVCSLRAAWLVDDLRRMGMTQWTEGIVSGYRSQARAFLEMAIRNEPFSEKEWYGPDADRDMGPGAVPYLLGMLAAEDKRSEPAILKKTVSYLQRVITDPVLNKNEDFLALVRAALEVIRGRLNEAAEEQRLDEEAHTALIDIDDFRLHLASLIPGDSHRFANGEVLFRHGDSGRSVMFILDGVVSVDYYVGKSKIKTIEARSGDLIGEVSALTGVSRISSATASTAVEVVTLPPSVLEKLAEIRNTFGLDLARTVAARFSQVVRSN